MINRVKALFKEYKWLLVLFFALFAAKMVLYFFEPNSPSIYYDEMRFSQMARDLYYKFGYDGTHYPLLYPLVMSVTFFFHSHFYEVAKIINFLLSTSIVFPIYAICRIYIDPKKSLLTAFACSFIPFSVIISNSFMSENLFFPLLMTACYIVLRKRENTLIWNLLLGAILGFMFMTRFISIVVIPVFLVMWWIKDVSTFKEIFKFTVKKVVSAVIIGITAVIAFLPWFIPKYQSGYSIKSILGFGIAEQTNSAQLTMANLLSWITLYGFYYLIMLAPVVVFVFFIAFRLDKVKGTFFSLYNRLIVLLLFLMGSFGVAIVRHSWRAYYNYLFKRNIMGRYVIYFAALFIIVAIVTVELVGKERIQTFLNSKLKKIFFVFLTNAAYIALVLVGVNILFYAGMNTVSPNFIFRTSAVDLTLVKLNVWVYLPIVIAANIAASILLVMGKKKFVSIILVAGLVVASVLSYPALFKDMNFATTNAKQAKAVSVAFRKDADRYRVNDIIYTRQAGLTIKDGQIKVLNDDLKYYLMDENLSRNPVIDFSGTYLNFVLAGHNGYAIMLDNEKPLSDFTYYLSYTIDNQKYMVYKFNRSSEVYRAYPGTYFSGAREYLNEYIYDADMSGLSLKDLNKVIYKMPSTLVPNSATEGKSLVMKFNFDNDTYIGLMMDKFDQGDFNLDITVNGRLLSLVIVKQINNFVYFKCSKGENLIELGNSSYKASLKINEIDFFEAQNFATYVPSSEYKVN